MATKFCLARRRWIDFRRELAHRSPLHLLTRLPPAKESHAPFPPHTGNQSSIPVALRFTCPVCGRTQENISSRFLGKRIQCPCGQVVRLGPKQSRNRSSKHEEPPSPLDRAEPTLGHTDDSDTKLSVEPKKKSGLPEFAPPPETVERMFGKRPPLPRTLHDSPPLNPVGGREDPFRDGVQTPSSPAQRPEEQMLFPPLDVPVAVTPVAVTLPYEYVPNQVPVTAYLGLMGGFLGMLQGTLVGLLVLFQMLKVGSLWNAISKESLGLTASVQDAVRNQLMIDSGLLGIVLLINIGLAVACGIQMISGVFEVRREVRSSRQASINSALVCGLYLVLLGVLAVLYWMTASQNAAQIPIEYSRETLFGSFITAMLFLAGLALLPTLLVGLGAVRSTER